MPHHPQDTAQPSVLDRKHEVLGLWAAGGCLLTLASLASHDMRGGENFMGPLGDAFASLTLAALGIVAWLFPLELGLGAYRLFTGRGVPLGAGRLASTMVFVVTGCTLTYLVTGHTTIAGGHLASGSLGELLGEVCRSILGTGGSALVMILLIVVTSVVRTQFSVVRTSHQIGRWLIRLVHHLKTQLAAIRDAWQQAKRLELEEQHAEELAREPVISAPAARFEHDAQHDARVEHTEPSTAPAVCADTTHEGSQTVTEPAPTIHVPLDTAASHSAPHAATGASTRRQTSSRSPASRDAAQPFELPPTHLFRSQPTKAVRVDEKALKANANRLVEKLQAYGVQGRVDEIHPGPVVTMYEFEPESGTKISKIAGLSDDLAMALAAQKVRIVAPIPGKARVGFELPNDEREMVTLRQIVEDPRWVHMQSALPVALGQDISGRPYYADLAKMPHLLVAGATGSGKSVGINVMLTSLLHKKTPEEVRFLMIDPKVVELAVFDGIPHMLLPVVTDMKKAALALRWAVDEMERRYQLFADAGARNIETYNERVAKVLRGEMSAEQLMPRRANKVRAQDAEGHEVLLDPTDDEAPDALNKPPTKLPYIVVVVDEFADLMMVAAKDVEAAIARLAQKARAAGIHVILATQRPSVDVITGMIKANFPARVAFKVSQREDSKTILGRQGAEHLLGMGDMLILPPGSSDLKRVHCAFISEDEVKEVCDFLRAQASPVYDENILKPRDDESSEVGSENTDASDDPLYDRAVSIVAQAGYCSISQLQRQLTIGYNKAAKLVDKMEHEGVVGPANPKAGGRREVFASSLL